MKHRGKNFYGVIFIACFLSCFYVSFLIDNSWGGEKQPPTLEQLAKGEDGGWLPPSIEELTQGKVKIGDLITKDNVDLVKEYLNPATYECVKKGMVLQMAQNIPPTKVTPKFFWESTLKNQGQAVSDQNCTVKLKDGSLWPGGLPFFNPKTPIEAMANAKFGLVFDDKKNLAGHLYYVSKDGKLEKEASGVTMQVKATGRSMVPPLGAIPGHENEQWRHIVVFLSPLEQKGTGQLTIRHYDESKDPDTGFAYISAFKRVIRISSTTYQDNVGGQDYTYGDPQGLREPFIYWKFTSLTKKLMLYPQFKRDFPMVTKDGKINKELKWFHGMGYPLCGWAITPVLVVEATPAIPHIYGKKVLYMPASPYWASSNPMAMGDFYDRQMRLWKLYYEPMDSVTNNGIDFGGMDIGSCFTDLQTGHISPQIQRSVINEGERIESFNQARLIQLGK